MAENTPVDPTWVDEELRTNGEHYHGVAPRVGRALSDVAFDALVTAVPHPEETK